MLRDVLAGFGWLCVLAMGLGLGLGSEAVFAQSTPSAYTTGYRWDVMRRLSGTIQPAASGTTGPFIATRYTYDANGQLILTEKGYLATWQATTVLPTNWAGFTVTQQTDVQYDAMGNKLSEMVSSAGSAATLTQNAYDADDRLTCSAVRMTLTSLGTPSARPSTSFVPSVVGACSQSVTNSPIDMITQNVYDAAGQLLQVQKAVATGLQQAYVTYGYSLDGKQTDVIDANGNHAQFAYDGFDRQTYWYFSSVNGPTAFNPATPASALATAGAVNAADYEGYGYDLNGNRTSLRKRDGTVLTYNYDALNRVTSKIVQTRYGLPTTDSRSVYYSYDLLGRQLTARFDGATGEGMTFAYDNLGRKTTSTILMDSVSRTLSYCYDGDGNRTVVSFADSVVGLCPTGGAQPTGWTNFVSYSYDGLDRPTTILRSGTATIASYAYYPNGTRLSFNSNGGAVATSYTYDPIDPIDRLATLTNNLAGNATYNNQYGFNYSPASQLIKLTKSNNAFVFAGTYNITRPYCPNGLNQYASDGSACAAGATSSACSATNFGQGSFVYDCNGNLIWDGFTSFLYDGENRLVGAGGLKNAALRYDPLGRLYEVAGPTATTRFLYDGDALVAEYDQNNNLQWRYVHGADEKADDPIASYKGPGFAGSNEQFMRPDWQGSIALVTDNAGSTIIAANTYDEYGIPGSANAGRFQYTGQAWISELGMYYYKARMYSPTLGRFMQTDPIGYKDNVNLYAYVANDPMDRTDPTGEGSCAEFLDSNPGGSCSEADDSESRAYNNTKYGPAAKKIVNQIATDMTKTVDQTLNVTKLPATLALRGLFIHQAFATAIEIKSLYSDTHMNAEVSYKGGLLVPNGTLGSVRVDAIYGGTDRAPAIVIELKTSGAEMSRSDVNRYYRNIPAGAQIIEIREIFGYIPSNR